MPVRGAPDAGDCGYTRVFFIQQHLQTQPMMPSGREQVVVHLEARLFFGTAIETAQVSQHIEVEARRSFQETGSCDYVLTEHDDSRFTQRVYDLADPFR